MKKLEITKTKVFIGLFILLVIGFIGFFYYRENNFSNEILTLNISGPETAVMGKDVVYTVHYKNNGNFALENPKITFQLPENSLTEDNRLLIIQTLDDVAPGQESSATFTAKLVGQEGDLKVAGAWFSYTPHNLTVRYESNVTFTTKIDIVPITLTYDTSSGFERGKEVTYAINYASDVDYPLENLSIRIDPVNGFSVTKGQPTSLDNVEWKINTLKKGQGGKILITGIVAGDAPDTMTFSAKLGLRQAGNFIVIRELKQDVQVTGDIIQSPSPSPSPTHN